MKAGAEDMGCHNPLPTCPLDPHHHVTWDESLPLGRGSYLDGSAQGSDASMPASQSRTALQKGSWCGPWAVQAVLHPQEPKNCW